MERQRNYIQEGEESYQRWRERLHADPEYAKLYAEEAERSELWLQLVEARLAAGLTQAEVARRLGVSQAQVSRIEKRGYESYTLRTLQRYVEALGDQFRLAIAVTKVDRPNSHATS